MTSRLSIIRDCLTLTGNNQYGSVDDDSPEWRAGTAAYDTAVEWALDEHDWGFGKAIEAVDDPETADGVTDSQDANFEYAYRKPDGCLHIITVLDSEGASLSGDWRLMGNYILANVSDGVKVEMVEEPDPDDWPGLFVRVIRHQTMAGMYRSLNKDTAGARFEERKAEDVLAKARSRVDVQEPGKVRFVSMLGSARRTRRG